MLGNTYSRCPLIGSIDLSIRIASLLNGTLWGFFIFINSAGMFQMLLSISISTHLARTALLGRTHVKSCHSISNLVSKRTEVLFSTVRMRGSSKGGNAGIFCFLDLLNRCLRLSAGLNSISSSVAVQRKVSFSREMIRRKVSKTPRCSIGSRCCFKSLGRISLIGMLPNQGKILRSRLRRMSSEWSCEIPEVFTFSSNHFFATACRVCSVVFFNALALSLLWACGSMPLASSDRYSSRKALANER